MRTGLHLAACDAKIVVIDYYVKLAKSEHKLKVHENPEYEYTLDQELARKLSPIDRWGSISFFINDNIRNE